eukprot:TRINITY_DN4089_c0_g1_i2.p2 TRINITY_DN4089_c0_g1~~TRINITY_DN4089_c0_g1_i2.p2  ORF type:complete len:209 (-),score=51.65 TRINITY_DN4089_c0_g1_i2:904-1530(-)
MYTHALPDDRIIWVQQEQDLTAARDVLLSADVVGVDSEAKPTRSPGEPSIPSLLQLATRTHVVVIDLIALADSAVLQQLLLTLWQIPHIVKLGIGLANDIRKLKAAFPKATCYNFVKSHIDMKSLFVEVASAQMGHSLQKMCVFCLDRHLDKTECMSDWSQRPLSAAQWRYAVNDVTSLLELFDWMRAQLQAKGLDVMKFCKDMGKKA